MKYFEIDEDHVLEVFQKGKTSKYRAIPQSASVKLLQFKFQQDTISQLEIFFLRGSITPILLKTIILNDDFKFLHPTIFEGLKIKYHLTMKLRLVVTIDHPLTMDVSRARILQNFKMAEAESAFTP